MVTCFRIDTPVNWGLNSIASRINPLFHISLPTVFFQLEFNGAGKSILCEEDPYLLELVRYIHLNPLRAEIVEELKGLNAYPYCGHYALMGKAEPGFQDVDYILNLFGGKVAEARRLYLEFVKKGVAAGRRPELTGGGLVRSAGGWSALRAMRKKA